MTISTRLGRAGAVVLVAATLAACTPIEDSARRPRMSLFIGIDVSGSFQQTGHYDDAIEFASHYLYGHLNGLGELSAPSAVFVGSVGGERPGETKSFQPIHAFQNKSAEEIAVVLRENFPPRDGFTDFNPFFDRVATMVKQRGLVLAPLNVVIFSDGVPDLTARPVAGEDDTRYSNIKVNSLEYLARSVTIRLLYATPTVSVAWERDVDRRRVRMWTVDDQVMPGWREQYEAGGETSLHELLWAWVADNVDFRVRSNVL